jgi:hypothetical protein
MGEGNTGIGRLRRRYNNSGEKFWGPAPGFSDITYGNGKFVAVGDFGAMTTSPDGVNWTGVPITQFPRVGAIGGTSGPSDLNIQTIGIEAGDGSVSSLPASSFIAVNYLNGLFLTGTALQLSNDLYYSTDGLNWERYSTGGGRIFGIDYDPVGGNYVMVGHMCKVIYSNNPLSSGSWADANTGSVFAGGTYYVYDVANDGKGTMIAVGSADYQINNDARMGISRDSGRTWTRVDLSGSSLAASDFIYEIHYLNGKWFAFCSTGKKAWSVDGETWWDLPNFKLGSQGLAYGGGIYVAGDDERLAYSANGTAWTTIDCGYSLSPRPLSPLGPQSAHFLAIAYGNKKFVAVTDGGEVLYSNDIE